MISDDEMIGFTVIAYLSTSCINCSSPRSYNCF